MLLPNPVCPSRAASLVADDPGAARYDANPLLAVIESYALDVIGALSPEEVEEAQFAVIAVYGEGLDWRRTVRTALRLGPRAERDLAGAWRRCRREARLAGQDPEPAEFARRFADDLVRRSLA